MSAPKKNLETEGEVRNNKSERKGRATDVRIDMMIYLSVIQAYSEKDFRVLQLRVK